MCWTLQRFPKDFLFLRFGSFLICLLGIGTMLNAQQLPDTSRFFTIDQPAYALNKGPKVCIDAGHNNFHTLEGRYTAFGNILRADGFRMFSNDKEITTDLLTGCDIYVISNPLHASNVGNWQLPNPSAFSESEINALETWVREGGSLFLIADHMPFAGAAQDLGRAFGFEFLNSFAMDTRRRNFDWFSKVSGHLHENALTSGIDSVVTFTGSAFVIPKNATPVLSLDEHYSVLMPRVAWQFSDDTPSLSGNGLYQLAYRNYGKGKVMVSGEAAMFSAQLAGPNQLQMGLNNPMAKRNIDLLRRLVGWLGE